MAHVAPERLCGCGCGVSIAHLRGSYRKHPDCTRRAALERKRLNGKRHPEQHRRNAERQQALRRSLAPRSMTVRNSTNETEVRRQKLCEVCCGMPWARLPTRYLDHIGGQTVTGDGSLCRGCGEPYAPEPPPEPVSVLASSAGTTSRAGALYGMSYPPLAKATKGAARQSRAKFTP